VARLGAKEQTGVGDAFPLLAATLMHKARLWPAYLMRHGPFLARLVFLNEKACIWWGVSGSVYYIVGLMVGLILISKLLIKHHWTPIAGHQLIHEHCFKTEAVEFTFRSDVWYVSGNPDYARYWWDE